MSIENYEQNISNLQRKLNEINQSFNLIEQDLHNEEDFINQSISKQSKSFQTKDPPNTFGQQGFKRSRDFQFSKQDKSEPEEEYQEQPKNKMLEEIISQNDNLKEDIRQKDVQIESLQFRYEKLQSELTLKMKEINQLHLEIEDKDGAIKKLSTQKEHLEEQVNRDMTEFRPHYQKLKSQYDVCLLEMKSLENDNAVLEKRIRDLSSVNLEMKNQNRELKNDKHKIEMEKLQALKTIELLKQHLSSAEHDFNDINEKNENLAFENERLKNELAKQEEILKLQQKSTNMQDTILKTDFSKKFQSFQEIEKKSKPQTKRTYVESNKKVAPLPQQIPKSGYKNKTIYDDIERLDFGGLKNLDEKLSRVL